MTTGMFLKIETTPLSTIAKKFLVLLSIATLQDLQLHLEMLWMGGAINILTHRQL